ncbi:SMI1/KNR4 family protein [Streptomyces sp. NBC_01601]|uniref:SMI1/KNR4 family protein n=1 Tax=Streptomyces sp. NBC_01601 TaxID=2975892 RepID=UPI002E288381|nr:SMI1/KNR4 family protein [Streptomyces sp. NBC_01601]
MWPEFIATLPETAEAAPPATEAALADCATALGHALPPALTTLLAAADGITGEHGTELLWPAERLAAENVALRGGAEFAALYMPFDPLVFFGETGGGDLYAVLARIDRPDVFVWDHETDSRTWAAGSLADHLRRAVSGLLDQ